MVVFLLMMMMMAAINVLIWLFYFALHLTLKHSVSNLLQVYNPLILFYINFHLALCMKCPFCLSIRRLSTRGRSNTAIPQKWACSSLNVINTAVSNRTSVKYSLKSFILPNRELPCNTHYTKTCWLFRVLLYFYISFHNIVTC